MLWKDSLWSSLSLLVLLYRLRGLWASESGSSSAVWFYASFFFSRTNRHTRLLHIQQTHSEEECLLLNWMKSSPGRWKQIDMLLWTPWVFLWLSVCVCVRTVNGTQQMKMLVCTNLYKYLDSLAGLWYNLYYSRSNQLFSKTRLCWRKWAAHVCSLLVVRL